MPATMAHCHCRGVDPVDMESEGIDPPYCPHGPTLVFEHYYADQEPRRFYACALHRDRKGCSFFHWEDEPIPLAKRERWKAIYEETRPKLDRAGLGRRLSLVCSSAPGHCGYCSSCGCLLLPGEWEEHKGHDVRRGVSVEEVREPTGLLSPMEERKAQAQFFFSPSTVNLFCSELQRLKFTHLLCVGTPRPSSVPLNTTSVTTRGGDVSTVSPVRLCCHDDRSSSSSRAWVEGKGGGGELWRLAGGELPTLLVFPYFMESHLSTALPSLTMSDYQVTYENHRHFSSSHKKPKPSPVRIFTNLPPPGSASSATGMCVQRMFTASSATAAPQRMGGGTVTVTSVGAV